MMKLIILAILAFSLACSDLSAQDSTRIDSIPVRTDLILVQSAFPDSAEIDSLILAEYGIAALIDSVTVPRGFRLLKVEREIEYLSLVDSFFSRDYVSDVESAYHRGDSAYPLIPFDWVAHPFLWV